VKIDSLCQRVSSASKAITSNIFFVCCNQGKVKAG
jgi:hypothetical protein